MRARLPDERSQHCRRHAATGYSDRRSGRLEQLPEHRIARVLRNAGAVHERQEREIEIARTPAEERRVECRDDCLAAAVFRAAHEAAHDLVGSAPVELEPAGAASHRGCTGLHGNRRLVREDERNALSGRASRCGEIAVCVRERQDADGREQERSREPPAEKLDTRVALRHVMEHARDDAPALECVAVRVDRALESGPACDVCECSARHLLARTRLEPRERGWNRGLSPACAAEIDLLLTFRTLLSVSRVNASRPNGVNSREAQPARRARCRQTGAASMSARLRSGASRGSGGSERAFGRPAVATG